MQSQRFAHRHLLSRSRERDRATPTPTAVGKSRSRFCVIVICFKRRHLSGLETNQLPHRIRWRDPRATAHRPTGAILHFKLEPQPRTFLRGMAYDLIPFRAQARNALRCPRPFGVLSNLPVKELNTAKSSIGQSFQVSRQPFFRNVAADQMKPCLRSTIG